MALIQNKPLRYLVFGLGILALVAGFIGIFLPLLPTTPFILLATWCFFKSSPKTYSWIRQHPRFGPILKDWEERKAIARSTKILAILMIALSLTGIWLKASLLVVKIALTVLLATVSLFIVTRPE